jgi:hypothetical protein
VQLLNVILVGASRNQKVNLHYGPRVDSTSNINEYKVYLLRGKCGQRLGPILPHSIADCLEILLASTT